MSRIERAAFVCAWAGIRFSWYGERGQDATASHGFRIERGPAAQAAWHRCRRAHGVGQR
jgi:hypothetical protein